MLTCLLCSYHSNLQTKVRPLQDKVKNSLTENNSRLKVMEEKYEVRGTLRIATKFQEIFNQIFINMCLNNGCFS